MRFSSEFKVGIFALIGTGLIVGGYVWSLDGVRATEASYVLDLTAPTAEGLYPGSPVRLAGIEIGAIDRIDIEGDHVRMQLRILAQYELPVDSVAQIRSSGLLGDRYIQVVPGVAEALLQDGDTIAYGAPPGDTDEIIRQVERITEDVAAIASEIRTIVEDDTNKANLEATLANIERATADLADITSRNKGDVEAILDSVRRLTQSLEGHTGDIAAGVDEELAKLQLATDTLQVSLEDVNEITGRIERGEGTIGALVNDRSTIDSINETIDNVNAVVEGFSGLHAEVYYTHRYFVGTDPQDEDTFFFGNPATGGSNNIGVLLMPQEDFWWIFEINDYPTGTITYRETYVPSLGEVYTEWRREPNYRFTFQMSKRWYDWSFRLGVKESGGGLGATYYAFDDRLRIEADVFDFTVGSYPAVESSGLPNLRVGTVWEPIDHVYLTAGSEQVLLGAKYGFFTGFVGGGFHFTDDDIKLLLATLPLGF